MFGRLIMIKKARRVFAAVVAVLLVCFTVAPVLSANAATQNSWNFKNSNFKKLGTIKSSTTVDGLGLMATSSKNMKVKAESVTVDGTAYTYCLALSGTGTTSYRSVKVPVSGSDTIKVVLRSSGSSTRNLIVADSNTYITTERTDIMLQENLIMLRSLADKTQEDIAEVIGISRQAYAKWERGETIPDIEKCGRLAEFYGVTMDSLIKDDVQLEGQKMAPAPKGKHMWGVVTVNDRGQIVIPKEARETFGLVNGSRLVVLGDDNEGIALVKAEQFEEKLSIAMSVLSKDIKE
jgi:AbrB family looped-hinge helix DNA binding protein